MLQQFLMQTIARTEQEGDMTSYYAADGELLAESIVQDNGAPMSYTLYDAKPLPFLTNEERLASVQWIQQQLQQDELVIEEIHESQEGFTVELVIRDPQYGVLIPFTGIQLFVDWQGYLQTIDFQELEVTMHYPANMISKEEATAILQQQQLLHLTVRPDVGWHYVYAPNFDIMGIEANGEVRLLQEQPEMAQVKIIPVLPLNEQPTIENVLTAGRDVELEVNETEDGKMWYVEQNQPDPTHEKGAFLQACRALKALVGEQYEHYQVVEYGDFYEQLGMEMDEQSQSFEFIYTHNGITLDFCSTTILVNSATNQIETVHFTEIPFDELAALEPPKISLELANSIAQQFVRAELEAERDGFESTDYSFYYGIHYPSSPTKGNLHYVDAWTGEIHYVNTGFEEA